MRKPRDSEQGFTLMEVVISIGIIAVLSWFILQFFVVSSNANARAGNIDRASIRALALLETVKSLNAEEDLYSLPELAGAHISVYDVAEEFLLNFDKNWNISAEAARFKLKLIISGDGPLVMLRAEVRDLKGTKPENSLLVSYETYKFFGGDGQ